MRSKWIAILVAAALSLGVGVVQAAPADRIGDDHSSNLVQKALRPIKVDKGIRAQGSDLAFKGKLVFAGSYQGLGIFRTSKAKPYLKQISFLQCAGGQGDVSVLGNYAFASVDSTLSGPTCSPDDTKPATQDQVSAGQAWEGIRIYDVSDPRNPRYLKSVYTDCGSHTNTILPGPVTSHIYIESYPISGQNPNCSYLSHRKVQIIEFPTADPTKAKLLEETIDTTPSIGCHDITTFPDRNLMAGACISQSMIWDIKDPAKPELLATITNPDISIHHSTAMTWDGKILVLGDEFGGAEGGGCTGDEDSTVGAAWFYDVSDPSNPTLMGHHSLPRVPQPSSGDGADRVRCTNHNFNVIPVRSDKYLLVVCYYMGGIAVVDFTDPTDPTEVAHYVTAPGGVPQDTWSAYWYNGRIYTNDYASQLGVGVYAFKGATNQTQTRFFRGVMNPQVQFERNLRE